MLTPRAHPCQLLRPHNDDASSFPTASKYDQSLFYTSPRLTCPCKMTNSGDYNPADHPEDQDTDGGYSTNELQGDSSDDNDSNGDNEVQDLLRDAGLARMGLRLSRGGGARPTGSTRLGTQYRAPGAADAAGAGANAAAGQGEAGQGAAASGSGMTARQIAVSLGAFSAMHLRTDNTCARRRCGSEAERLANFCQLPHRYGFLAHRLPSKYKRAYLYVCRMMLRQLGPQCQQARALRHHMVPRLYSDAGFL